MPVESPSLVDPDLDTLVVPVPLSESVNTDLPGCSPTDINLPVPTEVSTGVGVPTEESTGEVWQLLDEIPSENFEPTQGGAFDPNEFTFFARYKSGGVFSRRFWYAFGTQALSFISILGLLVTVTSKLIFTSSLLGLVVNFSFINPAFAAIMAFAVFTVISLIYCVYNTIKKYKELHKFSNDENWFIFALIAFTETKYLFQTFTDSVPLYLENVRNLSVPKEPSMFSRIKSIAYHGFFTFIGTMGFISSINSFTGIGLWSSAVLIGPISPLLLSFTFIFISIVAVIYLKCFKDVKFEHFNTKEKFARDELWNQTFICLAQSQNVKIVLDDAKLDILKEFLGPQQYQEIFDNYQNGQVTTVCLYEILTANMIKYLGAFDPAVNNLEKYKDLIAKLQQGSNTPQLASVPVILSTLFHTVPSASNSQTRHFPESNTNSSLPRPLLLSRQRGNQQSNSHNQEASRGDTRKPSSKH